MDGAGPRLIFLCGLAALSACAEPAPLPALVDGCTRFESRHDGQPQRCAHTPETEVRVWVPTERPPRVEVDGDEAQAQIEEVDTGFRATLTLPDDAERLRILDGRERAFTLALAPVATATPTEPRAREAYGLLQRARRLLRAGEPAQATATATRAAALAPGHMGIQRTAILFGAFVQGAMRGDLVSADMLIRAAPEPDREDARGRFDLHHQRGLIASRSLDMRLALADFSAGERIGRRVSDYMLVLASHEHAALLTDLGRGREAAALVDALDERAMSACTQGARALTAGWARLVARPKFEVDRAFTSFKAAERIYTHDCQSEAHANNARVNLAMLELSRASTAAESHLLRVQGPEHAYAAEWHLAVRAEIELRKGKLKSAREALLKLLRASRATSNEGHEWQAEVGLGLLAEAEAGAEDASEHYRAAEVVLDRQVRVVPVFAGQRFLLEDRAESLRGLVRTSLAQHRPHEALAAIRRAKRRALERGTAEDRLARLTPDARRAWLTARAEHEAARADLRAAESALQAAPKDERRRATARVQAARANAQRALDAVLVSLGGWQEGSLARPKADALWVVPALSEGGGHILLVRGDQIVAHEVSGWPKAAQWSRLLAPHLAGARRVEVLTNPSAAHRALARAPWQGAPLGLQVPVRYSLDLVPTATAAVASSDALVVFDPRGDLADARAEGRAVRSMLSEAGRTVHALGPDAARPEALVEALGRVGLFHYAGHAEFAGPQGWQSRLLLSRGELAIPDLVTLEHAPRWAVLTGCETAKSAAGVSAAMGLGQAFLLAGSEAVVATTERVDSEVARRFSEALYAGWSASGAGLDAAFVSAARTLDRHGQDWTSFVLLARAP